MYGQKHFDRKNQEEALEDVIIEIFAKHKDYSYRRVTADLKKQGYIVNKKKVKRLMKKLGLNVKSFTRKSNCLDNTPIENFFGLLKQEIYHGNVFNSFEELESKITWFINYYNNER